LVTKVHAAAQFGRHVGAGAADAVAAGHVERGAHDEQPQPAQQDQPKGQGGAARLVEQRGRYRARDQRVGQVGGRYRQQQHHDQRQRAGPGGGVFEDVGVAQGRGLWFFGVKTYLVLSRNTIVTISISS